MSDICEHETFRDICGVCHRNTIIEKQETEITALRAVNDALSEQMMTMIDNAGKVAALRAEVDRLRAALDDADEALTQFTAFEEDCRAIMGNTNFAIVQERHRKIRAALTQEHPHAD